MNIKKISYLKFNYDISVINLQNVVDFCEENDIEYKELYEIDLEQQLSQLHKENQQLKEKLLKIFENIDISYNEWKKWKEELSKLKEI